MKRIVGSLLLFGLCCNVRAGVAVPLDIQWPAGEELTMLLDSVETVEMDSESFRQALTRSVKQSMRLDIDVTDDATPEHTVLQLNVDRFEVEMSSPDKTYHYASDSTETPDLLGKVLKDFVDMKMEMVLDTDKETAVFRGTEKLDGLVSRGGSQKVVLAQLLGRQLIEQMLIRNLTCPWLPTDAVQLGGSWEKSLQTESDRLGDTTTRYVYKFERWKAGHEGQVAQLAFTGNVHLGENALPEGLTLNDTAISGTALFDVVKGRLLQFKVMQCLSIAVLVEKEDASIQINTTSKKDVQIRILER